MAAADAGQNGEVRWTFVFSHKPVWQDAMGDPTSQGWTAIEEALLAGDRHYTVFVGHEHNYAKFNGLRLWTAQTA